MPGHIRPQIRLVCPYCYDTFPRWRIQFRCSGRPSRSGERCEAAPDQIYNSHFGQGDQLPVFSGGLWRYRASCPHCHSETQVRVCPSCHHRLPTHFGRIHSRLVALVGARESGKTVYLTVLIHELTNRSGERLGSGVWGADEETRRVFAGDYERWLYQESQLLEATRTVAATRYGLRPPLVFSYATSSGGSGRPARLVDSALRPARKTLLSFFDTAGEDLISADSVELNARYLQAASAVLLMLDPLQMPGGRTRAAADTRLPTPSSGGDDPYEVLQRITDLLLAGRRWGKVRKPLAVVFSKLDGFWDAMPPESVLRCPEPTARGVDEQDGLNVHAQIEALLHEWDGRRIDYFLQNNYRTYRYFGVSALGDTPTANNRVSEKGIQPYRVTDPFLWLLSKLGAVTVIRRRLT
ncbi:MAG: hypothetical protein ACRDTH_20805 [Pseudonocardiaceae bacterium]